MPKFVADMAQHVVLAVDDDPIQLELIRTAVSKLEYPEVEVRTALTVRNAVSIINNEALDMIISDQRLPDGSATDIVRASIKVNPLVPIVVVTAFESVQDAVTLLKEGARDYIVKPLRAPDIQKLLINTLEWHTREEDVNTVTGAGVRETPDGFGQTTSEPMRYALGIAARAADSEASVLIRGESGTGKEVLSRLIHRNSKRANGPFVAVNVAAIPETLVESELFGHTRGAYTGAHADRVGYFEKAQGGTLFIDELGDIPLNVQVKLLRAIQAREIQPLGSEKTITLDVRIVTATNRNLELLIESGRFREDLFYRLNVITIEIPPLRSRKSDIPLLIENFIRRFAAQNDRKITGISQRALNLLIRYDFPGNIRELENVIERAVVLCRSSLVKEDDLPPFISGSEQEEPVGSSLDAQVQGLERKLILEALRKTDGNQSRAAAILEITERRLRSRMERLKIDNPFS